jgi:hypothetical protein
VTASKIDYWVFGEFCYPPCVKEPICDAHGRFSFWSLLKKTVYLALPLIIILNLLMMPFIALINYCRRSPEVLPPTNLSVDETITSLNLPSGDAALVTAISQIFLNPDPSMVETAAERLHLPEAEAGLIARLALTFTSAAVLPEETYSFTTRNGFRIQLIRQGVDCSATCQQV